jgi:hypothetical protein
VRAVAGVRRNETTLALSLANRELIGGAVFQQANKQCLSAGQIADAPSSAALVATSPLYVVMPFPPKSMKTVIAFDRVQA